MNPRHLALPSLLLLLGLPGCAFARRENRPVWNAFEAHLVPEDATTFALTLPLTVPAGLLAILTDTLVAHPVQVVDDAWDDASQLWRNGRPDYEHRYYSEVAFTPVRAAITPLVFVGDFLVRSMFDVRDEQEHVAEQQQRAADRRHRVLAWLAEVQAGGTGPCPEFVDEDDAEVRAKAEAALAQANALGRLRLHRHHLVDPVAGLGDDDPVVRFTVLEQLPPDVAVPAAVQDRLRQDPDAAVRLLALRRWPSVGR